MSIDELVVIVSPPKATCFSSEAWEDAEEWLGFTLPDAFRDFAKTYGCGTFCDGYLQVVSPSDSFETFRDFVEYHAGVLRTNMEAGLRNIPFNTYPIHPGLLTWAADENGHRLHWLTIGAANNWPVIVESHEGEFEQFDLPMTTFLAQSFRNDIRPKHIWYQPFNNSELSFVPT